MSKLWPASPRAQFFLSLLLFLSAAAVFLVLPIGPPLAWIVILTCIVLLGLITFAAGGSIRAHIGRWVLFAFLLLFAVERLADYSLLSPQSHTAIAWLNWIQFLSSFAIAAGCALVFPYLPNLRSAAAADHDRFLAAMECSLDDFYIFDGVADTSGQIVDFRFSYINPNAERRLNTSRGKLLGCLLTETRPLMISPGLIDTYRDVVRTGVPFTREIFIDNEMIKDTWLNFQVVKLGSGIAITSRDVTERRRFSDRVQRLAYYDQLTGLPNRTLLQDRLQQAIYRAQRSHRAIAVFMLDIDHFKHFNDSLGHAHGDSLLTAVAERLLASVREMDTVARIGGDEFVVVMPEIETHADILRCGTKLLQAVSPPVIIGSRHINVTISAGVSIYPDSGLDTDALLKSSDVAMYAVKFAGRNGLRIFNENNPEDSPRFLEGTA